MDIDLERALHILGELGCDTDQIRFEGGCPECGHQTTLLLDLNELPDHVSPYDQAEEVKLSYWDSSGKLVKGSLLDMIVDRLGYELV